MQGRLKSVYDTNVGDDEDDGMELPNIPLEALQGVETMDSSMLLSAASLASSFSDDDDDTMTQPKGDGEGALSLSHKSKPQHVGKAPQQLGQAPQRHRSSFALFSAEKDKQVRQTMAQLGMVLDDNNVAQLVTDSWQNLNPAERQRYRLLSQKDRERYARELKEFQDAQRDSSPPCPASAFSEFAENLVQAVRARFPGYNQAEISKLLGNMWKAAPEDTKKRYRDREAARWVAYRQSMLEKKRGNFAPSNQGCIGDDGGNNESTDDSGDELPEISLDGLQTFDGPQGSTTSADGPSGIMSDSLNESDFEPRPLRLPPNNGPIAFQQNGPITSSISLAGFNEYTNGLNIPSDDSGRSCYSDRAAQKSGSFAGPKKPSNAGYHIGQVSPSQDEIQLDIDLEPEPLPEAFDPTPMAPLGVTNSSQNRSERITSSAPLHLKRSSSNPLTSHRTQGAFPGNGLARGAIKTSGQGERTVPSPVSSSSSRPNTSGVVFEGLSKPIGVATQQLARARSAGATTLGRRAPVTGRTANAAIRHRLKAAPKPTVPKSSQTKRTKIPIKRKSQSAARPVGRPPRSKPVPDTATSTRAPALKSNSVHTTTTTAVPEPQISLSAAPDVSHLDSFNADLDIDDPFEDMDDPDNNMFGIIDT